MNNLFKFLYFETTRACNLKCRYCSTGSNKVRDYKSELSLSQIEQRIFIPAHDLGTEMIDFSGGEFILRRDFLDILRLANEMGFSIGMASNGVLLDERVLGKIKAVVGENLIISLGINSFDEKNPETRETTYDFVLKKLQMIESFQIRANISVTIGEFNKKKFHDTVNRIREMHLPYNRIPFVPRNCPRHDLMFTKESLKEYFHPVLRKYYNGQVSYTPYFLSSETYYQISGQTAHTTPVPTNPPVACWVGAYYAINPEGDVSPCPMFADQVIGGNVLQTDLKSILYESELFVKIIKRPSLKGKCGTCRYNFTCGGCRVMAYYKTGDPFAEDPTCFIDELTEDEILKLEQETEKSFKNYVRMAKFGKIFNAPTE